VQPAADANARELADGPRRDDQIAAQPMPAGD
jgi:hypothetical protein